MKKKLIIAVRKSKLALAQANLVKERLRKLNPIIKTFQTVGDQILDKPLHEIGGKGVFIKSIEKALFEERQQKRLREERQQKEREEKRLREERQQKRLREEKQQKERYLIH